MVTPRLNLRALSPRDVDAMHSILSEEGVLRYFPVSEPPDRLGVERMISALLDHWSERGYGLWAVEARSSGELMGRCGLQYLPDTGEVEIDFILGQAHWGQGMATEAGQASLRYGFEMLGLARVVGIVHAENKASRRVLEKLGMAQPEERTMWGMPCYCYALDRAAYEWAFRRAATGQE